MGGGRRIFLNTPADGRKKATVSSTVDMSREEKRSGKRRDCLVSSMI